MAQPVRNEEARAVRDCYVAEEGFTFVSMDFSQIEMRDLAHVSQDSMLLRIFREGLDIHAETASRMFRIPLEQVDEKMHRYPAKRVGFGIVYGITAKGLWEQFFMAGLDMRWWTIDRCQELIDLWYGVYAGVKAYMIETGREARQFGFTRDQFGRIRWVSTIYSSDERLAAEAERQAGNNPIQSGAQQIIKEAMGLLVPLYRNYWTPGSYPIRPLIQIHDDLVFEVRDDLLAEWIPIMQTVMENAIKLDVPVLVDCKTGKRWGQLKIWKGTT
jgi:DNA polymerase-1